MELIDAIRKRRSIRRFKQLQVPEKLVHTLIDAARMAPSAGNMQVLRYISITNKSLVLSVFKETFWAAQVKPHRTPVAEVTSPTAFIAVVAPDGASENVYADAGAAIQNILLCAADNVLGSCWLGAFNKDKVDMLLDLQTGMKTIFLVALGFPYESPVMENIEEGSSTKYYLDDKDVLHVPKYTADAITTWK